ncbi:hypothetical protein SAY86_026043 [Trapa natans]|uniref:Uncharacterized protein n=1 Tax=Trapa natans TaxID=22666 RepID=A0AAN7KA56_TRANT|nr:hypothetical protein SAY86_026043 [Trapa natans]
MARDDQSFYYYHNHNNGYFSLGLPEQLPPPPLPLLRCCGRSPLGPHTRLPSRESDSLHRAVGSPWGVAAVLVFLLVMVSYQSSLHERWFPLLAR